MLYEFPVKKEPDPPPVADNGGNMHAAGTIKSEVFKENSMWQKTMVTSLNNSDNNFIRVLSKLSMSRYFPPFLTKSYLPIQIKSVIN